MRVVLFWGIMELGKSTFMIDSAEDNKISRILSGKMEPWANSPDLSWMTVTKYRRNLQLCSGVEMKPQKAVGKGITKEWSSRYQGLKTMTHSWPSDHLIASTHPKLLCVLDGTVNIRFYDYSLLVPKSTFILIPSGTPNSDGTLKYILENAPNTSCEMCWMRPIGDELHFWVTHSDKYKNTTWQWGNVLFLNQRLNLFLRLLCEELSLSDDSSISLFPQLLRLLITGLQREVALGKYLVFGQEEYPSWEFEVSVNSVEQAKDYIDAHYGSKITLENLARTVGMSRTSLAQRFKQQTGQTVGEYLTQRRLNKARELLRRSGWTVAAISKFVGFRSQTYFHNLFRRREKCTPLQYRKSSQKQ